MSNILLTLWLPLAIVLGLLAVYLQRKTSTTRLFRFALWLIANDPEIPFFRTAREAKARAWRWVSDFIEAERRGWRGFPSDRSWK